MSTLACPVISTVSGLDLQVLKQLEAAAVGEVQVDEQDVGNAAGDFEAPACDRVRRRHLEALAADDLREAGLEIEVVVDEQSARHHHAAMTAAEEGNMSLAPVRRSKLQATGQHRFAPRQH